MNNFAFAAAIAVISGVTVALVANLIGAGDNGASEPVATSAGALDADLSERLARIEATLERLSDGRMTAGGLSGTGANLALAEAQMEALLAKFEARLKPLIESSVKASVTDAIGSNGSVLAVAETAKRKPKREVSLATAAAEVGLSAEEEEALRRITRETTDAFLKLMTDKDHSLEDIRRAFEDARHDETKRAELATTYLPKAMNNLGGLMGVFMTHETKTKAAVGAKKMKRLERDYKIKDLDPLGIEDFFDDFGG